MPSNHEGLCSNRTFACSRRQMLKGVSSGFGMLAFAGIANAMSSRFSVQDNPLSPRDPHFNPRAKRVIVLCMSG